MRPQLGNDLRMSGGRMVGVVGSASLSLPSQPKRKTDAPLVYHLLQVLWCQHGHVDPRQQPTAPPMGGCVQPDLMSRN